MDQPDYSQMPESFDAFFRRQYPRYSQYIDQLRRQTWERLQQAQEAQTAARSDEPMTLEGHFVVKGETARPHFQQELAAIDSLRRAVYRHRAQLIDALVLAGFGLYLSPLFAATIAGLAVWRFYRKLVTAASAPCPNCGQPFGSDRRFPLTVGDDCCQHCGLSLKAQSNHRRVNE